MALGQLASLGFASNVLKQDIMDKMKKAEEKDKVEPYTKKLRKTQPSKRI